MYLQIGAASAVLWTFYQTVMGKRGGAGFQTIYVQTLTYGQDPATPNW